jgi:hypothetical protein
MFEWGGELDSDLCSDLAVRSRLIETDSVYWDHATVYFASLHSLKASHMTAIHIDLDMDEQVIPHPPKSRDSNRPAIRSSRRSRLGPS